MAMLVMEHNVGREGGVVSWVMNIYAREYVICECVCVRCRKCLGNLQLFKQFRSRS